MSAADITALSLMGVLILFAFVLPSIAESPKIPQKVRDHLETMADKAAMAFFILLAIMVVGIPLALLLFLA